MKNIKKSYMLGLILAVSVFALAACGGEKDENTLELIYQAPDDAFGSWMEKVKEEFEEQNEGVEVKITAINADEGEYPNKKILMMKSDKTSPDIIMEDTEALKPDAAAGYLEPLTNELEEWDEWDNFYDAVKSGVTGNDDELYGIPISTDVRGLWYNKKVFEEAGLPVPWEPETWDDVIEAAETIKDDVEVPFWMNAGKAMGEGTTMQTFLPLLYGTDAKVFDEDENKWVVESEGMLDALRFIDDIFNNDLGASLSWALTGQAGPKISTELMLEDEVGIALDGNWMPGSWQEDGNAPWPEWEDSIDFTALPTQDGQNPGHATVSGGWALSIPEKAANKELATEFIKLAASKDNLRYGSQLTTREDIAELDEYNQLTYQEKMTSFLEFTNYRPTYDEYPVISANIQSAVESVTTGNMTPEEAMEEYKKSVERDVGEENTISK